MVREFILFITYKACSGKNFVWGKNPFQYKNAVRLISAIFFIHIMQIAFLVVGNSSISSAKSFGRVQYLIALGILLFLPYLIEIIFSKKVLAKSISEYKEAPIAKNAKLIAFGYLIFNIGVLLMMIYFFRHKYVFVTE